ncbi:hypothetical protein C0J45_13498 [Silurus meridionalis]|uniref:Uncharacterized protein n=1 Tax=Silurus meridionalis TaxID=175797 RepID=A0A8T0AWM1_SILME|nr:hypothetical protein HF521_005509 [Silurus meridionalis]KAI5096604.1 hypothetical protein C0J45_13498 [Silurus meridionalis]
MEGEVRITPLDQEEDLEKIVESVAELKKEVKGIEELAQELEQVAANYGLVQERSKLLNTSLKHLEKTSKCCKGDEASISSLEQESSAQRIQVEEAQKNPACAHGQLNPLMAETQKQCSTADEKDPEQQEEKG